MQAGIPCTLLVHELPRLLRERGLVQAAAEAALLAGTTVFAAPSVRDRFAELVALDPARVALLPQGLYRPPGPVDAPALRRRLSIPEAAPLVLGLGHADLRKGFDLFLQVWRSAHSRDAALHFLWVGGIAPDLLAYLGADIAAAASTGTFHHLGYEPDAVDWLGTAAVFLLTSREDPLPSTVLEAMAAGVPVVAFDDSGGAPELLRERRAGTVVPLADVAAMTDALMRLLAAGPAPERAVAAAAVRRDFDFAAYATRLAAVALPSVPLVSVAVPTYQYAQYLTGRLDSIFAQSHPIAEVLVLDDASTDGSAEVVRAAATAAGRTLRWLPAAVNGGSVFAQWHRAAREAQAEWLWIAEADDLSEPGFLAALMDAVRDLPDAVMAFSDSQAIDAAGTLLSADHQAYYAGCGAGLLAGDGAFDAAEVLDACLGRRNLILNASAVVFRRRALLAALDRFAGALGGFAIAGDWRVYAELLAGGGRVAYVARPLNRHRRHGSSVTARLSSERHLDEIARMQAHMRGVLGRSPGLLTGQRRAMDDARRALLPPARPRRRVR